MKTNKFHFLLEKDALFFFSLHFITISSLVLANLFFEDLISMLLYLVATLSCLLSLYYFYRLCIYLVAKTNTEIELEILSKQKQIQNEHILVLENDKNKIMSIQDNIYEVIKNDLTKNTDKAKEIIDNYINDLRVTFCQNKVVDAILYHKYILAKDKKIKLDIQAILPENLTIEDIDLMFLFNNLLDNAIEASLALPENERSIQLVTKIKLNYLIIKITNSKSEEIIIKKDASFTTKGNAEEHGLGLQIINRVCKKYNGTFSLEDEGSFVVAKVSVECQKSDL